MPTKQESKTVKLKKNKYYLVGTDGSIWEFKGKVKVDIVKDKENLYAKRR